MPVCVCVWDALATQRALYALSPRTPRLNTFRPIRVLCAMCGGSEGKETLCQVQMERVARQLAARLTCIELHN